MDNPTCKPTCRHANFGLYVDAGKFVCWGCDIEFIPKPKEPKESKFDKWFKNHGCTKRELWLIQNCLQSVCGVDHPETLAAIDAWDRAREEPDEPCQKPEPCNRYNNPCTCAPDCSMIGSDIIHNPCPIHRKPPYRPEKPCQEPEESEEPKFVSLSEMDPQLVTRSEFDAHRKVEREFREELVSYLEYGLNNIGTLECIEKVAQLRKKFLS